MISYQHSICFAIRLDKKTVLTITSNKTLGRVKMLVKLLIVLLLGYSQATWNVTCDFDLEGIAEIIKYLPSECMQIYKKGPTSELYEASLVESKKFAEFYQKLDQHERRESSTSPNEIPKQNTTLRLNIYNTTLLYTCAVDIGNRTDLATDADKTNKYFDCLFQKRQQMIELIPK